ncbi:MAG: hypothetical protein JSV32_02510, partial [Dehalococcoidia bacterium]
MTIRSLFHIIIIIPFHLALMAASYGGGTSVPKPQRKTYSSPPPMIIDSEKQYIATIKTNKGDLVL